MSSDATLVAQLRRSLPAGWEMVQTHDLGELGGYEQILQYRFLLLDLDERGMFEPIDAVRAVRMELMLNLPIFCFGGAPDVRDEARLARADRFFDRSEIAGKLQQFCEQFGWGG